MLVRQVVIPADAQELWDALTEPDVVAAWFGAQVEWDLRPGGPARFLDDDGTVRHGVVESVLPGRHLSFRWWRRDDGQQDISQVSYDLEPEEGGTKLTVTEQPLPAPTAPPVPPTSTLASAAAASGRSWTAWDDRLFQCWATAAAGSVGARPGGLAAGRLVGAIAR
jgi:uncharacterized protein YndB with AHSA1/START domain